MKGDNISLWNDRWLSDGSLLDGLIDIPSDILIPHDKPQNILLITFVVDDNDNVANIVNTLLSPMVIEGKQI